MKSKKLNGEGLEFLTRPSNSRDIFSYPVMAHDYVLYIGPLDSSEDEREKIQLIRTASPDDTIRLIINSPGGYVSLAMSYVSAINESAARIVTHAEGTVASAGTLLWLSGEERTVSPMTQFMFHNYQTEVYGDGANIFSQVTFEKSYFDRLIKRFYEGVLTNEEIDRIIGGGQVWLDEQEIVKRTKAVLLSKDYLRSVREGNVSAEEGGEDAMPELFGGPGIKVIKKDNNEVFLDLDGLSSEHLGTLNVKELYVVAEQLAGMVDKDLKTDFKVTKKSPRPDLEKCLLSLAPQVLEELNKVDE